MLSRVRLALREAFGRQRLESEMEREMRLHLEMETEANVRLGMSRADARRAALVAFGGIERSKEATRDERSTRWAEEIGADIRFALRGMRRQPAFTLAVVTLLAFGTGANAAMFSVLHRMILRPLPFADGSRMVQLMATAGKGQFEAPPPIPLIDLWARRASRIEGVTRFERIYPVLGDTTRLPRLELLGAAIQPDMFQFVGARTQIGRPFLPSDTLAGAPPVAILGHSLWKRQFAGRADVIGKPVLLDGRAYTVVGVAAPGFGVPFSGAEIFTGWQADPARGFADAIAKLRTGVTTEAAAEELRSLGSLAPPELRIESNPPRVNDGSSLTRGNMRRLVITLFGAVVLVLLIACANVANLLLVRAWARQREFAVRGAMGAGRGRMVRQLLTESLLLAGIGALAGVLIAIWSLKLLTAIQPRGVALIGGLDSITLGWMAIVAVVTGLLFGVAPALTVGDGRIGDVLRASTRAGTGASRSTRIRSSLVIGEIALSVVLLFGAGLLVRTLAAMQRADLGMQPQGLAALGLRLPPRESADSTRRRDAWISVLGRVRALPGVESATLALTLPPDHAVSLNPAIEGRPAGDSIGAIAFSLGMPDFFEVAGLRFVEGRPFAADHRLSERSSGHEVVINERFARRFWPNRSALGGRVKRKDTWATVVGVVADVDIPGRKGTRSGLQIYESMSEAPQRATLLVRSQLPAAVLELTLRGAIRESGPTVLTSGFATADEQVRHSRVIQQFTLALIGAFSLLALFMATIGLHAVISYSVTQRVREIGIRIALGAQQSQVAGLVLRQGVLLALLGVGVGCVSALAATRAMRSLLYGVEPGDPPTMVAVTLGLVATAVIASAIPARRATRVDPVEAIRAE